MPGVIPFPKKSRTKKIISLEDYIDALDAIELLVEETRPHCLDAAKRVIAEVKFCAVFNPYFREETKKILHEIIDELYAETQRM